MNDLNNVNLIGRLTKNCELTYSSSGVAICKISIAVNRSVKKNRNYENEVSFFDCTLFSKTAENLSKYLTKGQQVCISGELVQNRWEKDGKQMSRIEININHIQLIGSMTKDERPQQPQQPSSPESFNGDSFDDSMIPF